MPRKFSRGGGLPEDQVGKVPEPVGLSLVADLAQRCPQGVRGVTLGS